MDNSMLYEKRAQLRRVLTYELESVDRRSEFECDLIIGRLGAMYDLRCLPEPEGKKDVEAIGDD